MPDQPGKAGPESNDVGGSDGGYGYFGNTKPSICPVCVFFLFRRRIKNQTKAANIKPPTAAPAPIAPLAAGDRPACEASEVGSVFELPTETRAEGVDVESLLSVADVESLLSVVGVESLVLVGVESPVIVAV
jgi:hypothetical protein